MLDIDGGGLHIYVVLHGDNTRALSYFHNNFGVLISDRATQDSWEQPVHGAGRRGAGATDKALKEFRDHWNVDGVNYEEIPPPGEEARPMIDGMNREENEAVELLADASTMTLEELAQLTEGAWDEVWQNSIEEDLIEAFQNEAEPVQRASYRSLGAAHEAPRPTLKERLADLSATVRRKLRAHFGLADDEPAAPGGSS